MLDQRSLAFLPCGQFTFQPVDRGVVPRDAVVAAFFLIRVRTGWRSATGAVHNNLTISPFDLVSGRGNPRKTISSVGNRVSPQRHVQPQRPQGSRRTISCETSRLPRSPGRHFLMAEGLRGSQEPGRLQARGRSRAGRTSAPTRPWRQDYVVSPKVFCSRRSTGPAGPRGSARLPHCRVSGARLRVALTVGKRGARPRGPRHR